MRLAACIVLELAVAAGAVGGVWLGASRVADQAADAAPADPARAASAVPPSRPPPRAGGEPGAGGPDGGAGGAGLPRGGERAGAARVVPLERARLASAPPPPATVFAAPDAELLAPIAATPLAKVKLNRGGSSLSLRLDFSSGARAAFKPLQIHPQSDPRREIAAFRIDRLLGLGHVAPAKSASFAVDDLIAAVDPASRAHTAQRINDEGLARRGMLAGVVSWWIPEIKAVRIEGHLIDEPAGEAAWTAYLQADATPPEELVPMLAQISAAIVFDVVIDNADRWSGNNTQGSVDNRTLYFMDNTLSFSQYTLGHTTNLSKLYRIQVFPRGLIGRLRALTAEAIAAAIGPDDELLGPLLTAGEQAAVLARRDHLVAYVDRLIAEHGEAAVLALP